MKLPLSYSIRNLTERFGTTLMTASGIGLTVAVLVTAMALSEGLKSTFASTGRPGQAVVLRKGGSSELNSTVSEAGYQEIKNLPGIVTNAAGAPMASPEAISIVNLKSLESGQGMNVSVRGMRPMGIEMRDIRIKNGRWFQPGLKEVVVGESIAKRYPEAQVGKEIRFGRGLWKVVGEMSGGSSAMNSEIWCDLNQLLADFDRQGTVNSVLVRLDGPQSVPAFSQAVDDNQRLEAQALSEDAYYAKMTRSALPLQVLGTFVATIMAIGSAFGAMNTMYAAISRRSKEIGTLRALGFSKGSILMSFVIESVLLALVGGVLGILLALPLNNVTTGVGNFDTFSEIAFNFRVSPSAMAIGLAFAALIGAVGGFLPALAAANKDILQALRE